METCAEPKKLNNTILGFGSPSHASVGRTQKMHVPGGLKSPNPRCWGRSILKGLSISSRLAFLWAPDIEVTRAQRTGEKRNCRLKQTQSLDFYHKGLIQM